MMLQADTTITTLAPAADEACGDSNGGTAHDSVPRSADMTGGGAEGDMPSALPSPPGADTAGLTMPAYRHESFFNVDTLTHTRAGDGDYGVAGDPVPATMRTDDAVTILLLLCFAIAVTAISKSLRFIERQAKNFFYVPRGETTTATETGSEIGFQLFLMLQTCLLLALLQYSYTQQYATIPFMPAGRYRLMGIFFAVFTAYFAAKILIYAAVNTVFFGRRKSRMWLKSLLFITSVESVLVFPVALLKVYFDMPSQGVAYSIAFILIITKTLTFYKCFTIFFRGANGFLQIILYFCTLEIVPLSILWGSLALIVKYLEINF